ncbi:MAG: permease, partial [Rubrobacteraceae bacterium]
MGPGERAAFIRMTYTHLAGAILVFALLEAALLNVPGVERLVGLLTWSWLLTLGLFMVVSFLADRWARSNVSRGMQYAGLGLYIV